MRHCRRCTGGASASWTARSPSSRSSAYAPCSCSSWCADLTLRRPARSSHPRTRDSRSSLVSPSIQARSSVGVDVTREPGGERPLGFRHVDRDVRQQHCGGRVEHIGDRDEIVDGHGTSTSLHLREGVGRDRVIEHQEHVGQLVDGQLAQLAVVGDGVGHSKGCSRPCGLPSTSGFRARTPSRAGTRRPGGALRREFCHPNWPTSDPDLDRRKEALERYGPTALPALRVQWQFQREFGKGPVKLFPPKYESHRNLSLPGFIAELHTALLATHDHEYLFPAISGGLLANTNFSYSYWRPVSRGRPASEEFARIRLGRPQPAISRRPLPEVPATAYAGKRLFCFATAARSGSTKIDTVASPWRPAWASWASCCSC